MCAFSNCTDQDDLATSAWQVGKLCSKHLRILRKDYGSWTGIGVKLNDDFVKLHILIRMNPARCLEHIQRLESEQSLARIMNPMRGDPRFAKDKDNYLKLSRALEYYEGYCWFPANRLLLATLLTSEAFARATELGLNKDTGAGHRHGDLSHRLQWHVIMREVTNNFKTPINKADGWADSPLGLFYSFNNDPAAKKDGFWGNILDKVGSERNWGDPDEVMVRLRNANLPLVGSALERRVTKHGGTDLALFNQQGKKEVVRSLRDQQIWDETLSTIQLVEREHSISPYIRDAGGDPTNPHIRKSNVEKLRMAMEGYIYAWSKTGYPTCAPNRDKVEWLAYQVYIKIKRQNANFFNNGNIHYKFSNGNIIHSNAPDVGVAITMGRVVQSREGFNIGQYTYSATGAHPAPGEHNLNRW